MLLTNNIEECQKIMDKELLHTQLDHFVVYNSELKIAFQSKSDEGINFKWISATGEISLSKNTQLIDTKRLEIVAHLYSLIGRHITAVEIIATGKLVLFFDDIALSFVKSKDSFEVVWSLTPDTADLFRVKNWAVHLNDQSEILLFNEQNNEGVY